MEPTEETRPRFRSHYHDRREERSEKADRHISNLSEFLDKGSISKKQPSSILKNSASSLSSKSSKNYINESQRKEDRYQKPDTIVKQQTVVISDDDDDLQKEKESPTEKALEREKQLKAAEDDPDCPDGHVPLPENERLEALKLAKKRKKLPSLLNSMI